MHFENDRTISLLFPTNWPPRSPDRNPCDFWLSSYVKDAVFSVPIANLAEFKTRISQHIKNISKDKPRCVVEHDICRFEFVEENSG
ncbi:hypothetical protein AVEN_226368-1 [Araneus ventricosus]|uniref:Uncharacterized protein n=1 Tax=Araneus ventricosus TaxID=182803 RepID=A0A4Y2Q8K0_ARAVE|nr:hypothetical protein AVEN_226368-1 [Araneus ventricosus]